ncbi:MAG: hypothetical protein KGL39_57900, partial [Patescibacteria group bacterium]|nr:hypothetical protein [Patescibacteria group bacterium]
GKRFLQIIGFVKHQRPHPGEEKSKIPPPPSREIKLHGKKLNLISKNEIMSIKGDGDGDGEEGRGRGIGSAPLAPEKEINKKPKTYTAIQKVIRGFKEAKGIDCDDAAWDKLHFKRFARAAQDLLKVFNGNADAAIVYTLKRGQELDEKQLSGWGLEAVSRAAATDPKVLDLINGGEYGPKDSALDADSVDGPRRLNGVTRAGEIVGDALAGIKRVEISSREESDVAEPPEDRFDDEPFEP